MGLTEINEIVTGMDGLELTVSNVNANCSFGYWKHAPPEPYFEPSLDQSESAAPGGSDGIDSKDVGFCESCGGEKYQHHQRRMFGRHAAGQGDEKQFTGIDFAGSGTERTKLGLTWGLSASRGCFWKVEGTGEWIEGLDHPRLGRIWISGTARSSGGRFSSGDASSWGADLEHACGGHSGAEALSPDSGRGDAGLETVIECTAKIGYDRFLTVELYTQTADPQSAAEKSFAFFKQTYCGVKLLRLILTADTPRREKTGNIKQLLALNCFYLYYLWLISSLRLNFSAEKHSAKDLSLAVREGRFFQLGDNFHPPGVSAVAVGRRRGTFGDGADLIFA